MSKLLSYLIPGIIGAVVLEVIDAAFVSDALHKADWFVMTMAILQCLCIIISCVIYFVRTPPGKDIRP